ncbi:MAG: molybdopterin-dependent oxidoreductase [Deltaproteobacteria bacterium]|nr:molybdopterin-dependent oxidoreductase [Deltaproteobacteria bacterium]
MKKMNRREFLKKMAAASAVTAAAGLSPEISFAGWSPLKVLPGQVKWKKTPCRFCGVGCGLLVGIAKGRAVAVKGDPASPVNRGLCCVKGYHSIQALYGKDRLTYAWVRKNGKLVKTPIQEALNIIARKMQETIQSHGKDSVAMYGSGQWTIPDGYVASKFMKGAIGTNNIEANARLCMASAVTGFMTSFGADEPMGCYEDIDHADVFIIWGNNMAEMHPVLFSRLLEKRAKNPNVKIIDLSTRTTRTSIASDKSILFKPQTDLAIANAICHEIVKNGRVNSTFLQKHCSFKKGKTQIGYGLEDKFKFQDSPEDSSFEEYKSFLEDYAPEKAEKLTGVSAEEIRFLASLYGDPARKVMSLWCMGMNQHTRGTWVNNLVYNIHLLVGKISTPGNSPFSLTGQPSACGTVREVGTLTNRLPHGVVTDEGARKLAAEIWKVPVERIPAKPTFHTVEMFRALDRGEIRFMWIQVSNPMVSMPNLRRYRDGAKKEGRFIVVSDVYPTPTTDIADVILPSAMWIEREGMFGNSERRTQHFEKMIDPPGQAMSDTWQIIEVARRMGFKELFPWDEKTHIEQIWNEYTRFHANSKHALASYDELKKSTGVIWPYVNGKETKWRYNPKFDPAAKQGDGFDFYGTTNHRACIWLRPFEPAAESPNEAFPFWLNTGRVLEHWHTGSLTRRIPILHRAVPKSYVELHPQDAKRLGIKNGNRVKLTSRRGSLALSASVNKKGRPAEGQVFVPFFDEDYLINELTLDAYCPISAQPDYKKCAVRVESV